MQRRVPNEPGLNMSDQEKRKLRLMPEVLPDPRLAKKDRDRGPRERTLEHMRRLLTLTTSASAIAACSHGYAVVDPLPPPGTATIGPPVGPPDAGSVTDADTPFGPFAPLDASLGSMDDTDPIVDASLAKDHDAGAKKKKPPVVSTVPTRGYMVVDPLPPPSMQNPRNRKP
jgi:hypothetical protein